MLDIPAADTLVKPERRRDISSWKQVNISPLNTKQKKRFYRYKAGVIEYFTTDTPLKTIAKRYRLSTDFILHLAKQCLQQDEDGTCYGYCALLPEAKTLSHPSMTLIQITPAKDKARDAHAAPPSPVGARFITASKRPSCCKGAINRAEEQSGTGRAALTGGKRSLRACKNGRSTASCANETNIHRADERIRTILPERAVLCKRKNGARQQHRACKEATEI